MINYRKVRSKIKTKENFFKLELKDIGIVSPKKFSKIIVNDIKLDFSIKLIKKPPSTNNIIKPIKSERKNFIKRDKSFDLKINNNNKNNINLTKNKSIDKFNSKNRNKTPEVKNYKNLSVDKIIPKKKIIIRQKTTENLEKKDNNIRAKNILFIKKETKNIIMRSKEYNNKNNNISISGKKISNNNNTKLKAERKNKTPPPKIINSSDKIESQQKIMEKQNIINEKIILEQKKIDVENNIFKNEKIANLDNNKNIKDKIKDIKKIKENNNQISVKDNKIELTFISCDQSVNHSIKCDLNDQFLSVEKTLYDELPILRNKGCTFLFNGAKVKRLASLRENLFQNGDIILIFYLNQNFIAIDLMYKDESFPKVCNLDDCIFELILSLEEDVPEIKNKNISLLCKGMLLTGNFRDYGIISGDIIRAFDEGEIAIFDVNILKKEKLEFIIIHFISTDQNINFAIRSIKFAPFYVVENELYKKFPDYRNKKCFFTGNGKTFEVQKTLEENKIKSGDVILVCPNEED